MSANPDSVVNQGEFHSSIPPAEPMHHHGHNMKTKVGNEAHPESHVEVLPPGTAPQDRSFRPNTTNMVPGRDEASNLDEISGSGGDILPGATSKDVENDWNRPTQGQTSRELHGSGAAKGQKEGHGLAGQAGDPVPHQRRDLPRSSQVTGEATSDAFGTRQDLPEEYVGKPQHEFQKDTTGAEDKLPVSSEELASERR